MDPIIQALAEKWGVNLMGAKDEAQFMAMDAQPTLITQSNSGVLAMLSTYIEPRVIKVLLAPMKAAEIVGDEVKKGDWVTTAAEFPIVESTGEVSSYGDYSNNGRAGANINWIARQPYTYQTFTEWGEQELERMGLAKLDWAGQQNLASVLTLNKFQNSTYFFGVAGLKNYGLLNDPSLLAPITPLVKSDTPNGLNASLTSYTQWANASALDVYNDILALYSQLLAQAGGLLDFSEDTPMTLAMSPSASANLRKTNMYNVNVLDQLKANFPKLRIITAPEYATASGNLVQLIVDEMEGQRTASVAFTEKLRAHPMIVHESSFRQKKSQGTWGCIIFRPFLVAGLLGV
jgi:hypothetical protein